MKLSAWLSKNQIENIITFLNNFPRNSEDRTIANEAIGRLKKYSGEYLVNILPDSRPEYIAARRLIMEQF